MWRGRSPESSSLWTELSDWPNTRQDCSTLQECFELPSNDPGAAQILRHNLLFVRLGLFFFSLNAKIGKPVTSLSAARPIRGQQPHLPPFVGSNSCLTGHKPLLFLAKCHESSLIVAMTGREPAAGCPAPSLTRGGSRGVGMRE